MTVPTPARGWPADRNRVVDLLRVGALTLVVLGHWLKQGWYVDGAGELHRSGLLGIAPWTHPLTWAFQVIPVLFVVGGFANARSWRSARRRGVGYGGWLAGRTERLTRPVLPLLVFWVVVAPAARTVDHGGRWLEVASVTSLVPTWFLATYVVVVALTPLVLAAWERWGGRSLVAGVVATLAVDLVSIGSDTPLLGAPNLLLVYGTHHQLGVAWAEGWFTRRRRAVGLAAVGLPGALLLVALGPYGVSMVGVSGYGLNNTHPPRATVLFLGLFLAGAAIAAEPGLRRLADITRVWSVVVVVEARLMTVYLWHLTALGVAGAAALALGGLGLHARPGTAEWWALRPVWFAVLAVVTALAVLAVGWCERSGGRAAVPDRGAALPLAEVAVTAAGLGALAAEGMTGAYSWWVALALAVTLGALDRTLVRTPHRGARDGRRPPVA